ncbi:MAG TPA: FAD-dependent oxidoreductase, partial [Bacillota bacterium]|nr:FAD-dependent oxidoreductase [Bacillota bacterium]
MVLWVITIKERMLLVGAGIMSATLATILKEVEPDINITIYEKLAKPGEESSNEWNNAGTGHSALCELNYTTENQDGSIDISKAITINEQFQISKQFWSYLVNTDKLSNPSDFINPLPHISWVRGEANVAFLKKRFHALIENPLFQGMEYTDDVDKLEEWMPLIMHNRVKGEAMAATKIDSGTDVNFGALTRKLLENLEEQGVQVKYNHTVKDFERMEDGTWEVKLRNFDHDTLEYRVADFLFIGAG